MITEDYVSFETAKLLKEKGFNETSNTIGTYNDNGVFYLYKHEKGYNHNHLTSWYSAPTLQMAMKWLREVHNIWIEFVFETIGGHVSEYKFKLHFLKADHSGFKISNRAYVGYYKTYEEAADNAISYCLEREI